MQQKQQKTNRTNKKEGNVNVGHKNETFYLLLKSNQFVNIFCFSFNIFIFHILPALSNHLFSFLNHLQICLNYLPRNLQLLSIQSEERLNRLMIWNHWGYIGNRLLRQNLWITKRYYLYKYI